MKLLKGKRGINFHDLGFGDVFLDGVVCFSGFELHELLVYFGD